MAATRTLAQMRTAVQTRGGYEGSDDITSDVLDDFLNSAIAEVWDIVIKKWADQYTVLSNDLAVLGTVTGTGDSFAVASGIVTLTDAGAAFKARQVGQRITTASATSAANIGTFRILTVPTATTLTYENVDGVTEAFTGTYSIDGASAVALPLDFYKLRKVEAKLNDTTWRRIYPHDLEVAHRFATTSPSPGHGLRYRLQASKLEFSPPPVAGQVVRMYYIPVATRLAATTDTFDGINGYEELVEQIAFRRCRGEREELDTSQIEREVERLSQRVRADADSRDAGEPFYLNPYGPDGNITDDDGLDWWP